MIRYYARYDADGNLLYVGTVCGDCAVEGEITELEYNALLATVPKPEPVEPVSDIDEALAILSGEVTE